MPANRRRLIVCDDATWAAFLAWGAAHGVKGYHGRVTVAATLQALLRHAELPAAYRQNAMHYTQEHPVD